MLLKFLPVLPILILLGLISIRHWGAAILTMLVWAMFEGAVRKWIFPEYQQPVLLLKDVVLIFSYVGYLFSANRNITQQKSGLLKAILILSVLFCCVQLLNPNLPSILLGLYGLKNYIIYIPLSFIIPDLIRTREDLRKFAIAACVISIPIALLGLYQFSQPPSSWINQYLSHEEGVDSVVATFGEGTGTGDFASGRARTSSTFSYIGGFVTFLMFAVPMAAALLLASVPKGRTAIIVLAALALSIGGAATTGSRLPFVIFAIAAFVMLPASAAKGLLSGGTVARLLVGGVLLGAIILVFSGGALSALEYRSATSDNPWERILAPATEVYDAYQTSPIIGTGIGTNSNASISIMGGTMPWWLGGYAYEGEPARVMQELGFGGFTLIYLAKVLAILLIAGYLRHSRDRLIIAVYMATLVFVGVHLALQTVNSPTGGLMYWTLLGVAIAAHSIEQRENNLRYELEYYASREDQLDHWSPA